MQLRILGRSRLGIDSARSAEVQFRPKDADAPERTIPGDNYENDRRETNKREYNGKRGRMHAHIGSWRRGAKAPSERLIPSSPRITSEGCGSMDGRTAPRRRLRVTSRRYPVDKHLSRVCLPPNVYATTLHSRFAEELSNSPRPDLCSEYDSIAYLTFLFLQTYSYMYNMFYMFFYI